MKSKNRNIDWFEIFIYAVLTFLIVFGYYHFW